MNWEDLIINMAVGSLLLSFKNPARVLQLKAAMLKLYRAIKIAYASDPDFQ